MVETIAPVVHGDRRSRYRVAVALHALGATLAAATFGAALGALGALLGAPWGDAGAWLVAAVAALYLLREGLGVPVPVPDRHRQVPSWWHSFYSPPVAAFLYGVGLGIGFLTFLTFGTFVAVSVAAIASGSPVTGVVVCAPFGLARALAVAGAHVAGASGVDDLERAATARWPRLLNALALGVVVAAALAAAGAL
ncbi:MAG TPA: sulfite exporter TauE/SafE family protein [Actinomycetota bacterium]|nr:sulfite exporter TauE/SafE family protein [Actinomycetota bacterium]